MSARYGRLRRMALLGLLLASTRVEAGPAPLEQHPLPDGGMHLLDQMRVMAVDDGLTLIEVARREGIGQEEIRNANPMVDRWQPAPGSTLVLTAGRLLPAAERKGIVINLPEFRLYYFTPQRGGQSPGTVVTTPISVVRMDWKTPLGTTRITAKQKDPSWTPPESIRAEHAADGEILPAVVPPGPDNPLGGFALRLGIPGYLIHGTDKAYGVGMQVTHGCMRLLPEHVEALFGMVPVGTPVLLMNEPVKLGWGPAGLYVEAHPPLEEDARAFELDFVLARERAQALLAERNGLALDTAMLSAALIERTGLPVLVAAGAAADPRDHPPTP